MHGSWEGLDDVAKAGVGANYQAENPEKHQRHVLRNHYWPLRSVAHRPKCADLDDRGERQSQAREAQGAEQRYEEVQLGDRHGQQDCKKRTENRFNRRSVILLRLNVFFSFKYLSVDDQIFIKEKLWSIDKFGSFFLFLQGFKIIWMIL